MYCVRYPQYTRTVSEVSVVTAANTFNVVVCFRSSHRGRYSSKTRQTHTAGPSTLCQHSPSRSFTTQAILYGGGGGGGGVKSCTGTLRSLSDCLSVCLSVSVCLSFSLSSALSLSLSCFLSLFLSLSLSLSPSHSPFPLSFALPPCLLFSFSLSLRSISLLLSPSLPLPLSPCPCPTFPER